MPVGLAVALALVFVLGSYVAPLVLGIVAVAIVAGALVKIPTYVVTMVPTKDEEVPRSEAATAASPSSIQEDKK